MIRFVVALPSEARPLIDRYGLRRCSSATAFPIYETEGMTLIASGTGKVAAAATAYLDALTGSERQAAWLNIGVAGHRNRRLGDGVLAHCITDQATRRNWYPPLVFKPPCDTAAVFTVDAVESEYPEASIYDMEASGYYPTACRFRTTEIVHCFKIVSDNAVTPPDKVDRKIVKQLIEENLDVIDELVQQLASLSEEVTRLESNPPEIERFLKQWRFTVAEQNTLRRLLLRWQALCPDQDVWCDELEGLPKGKDVLLFLDRRLDTLPTRFSSQ